MALIVGPVPKKCNVSNHGIAHNKNSLTKNSDSIKDPEGRKGTREGST